MDTTKSSTEKPDDLSCRDLWKQHDWAAFALSYGPVSTWAVLAISFSWRHVNIATVGVLITTIALNTGAISGYSCHPVPSARAGCKHLDNQLLWHYCCLWGTKGTKSLTAQRNVTKNMVKHIGHDYSGSALLHLLRSG